MGACPDWYPLVRAARYIGEPDPARMLDRPQWWVHKLLMAEAAEAEAQVMRLKEEQARQRRS